MGLAAPELVRDEMHRLATFLRQNPSALALPVEQIAAQSGVGEDAVRSVVSGSVVDRRDKPVSLHFDLTGALGRLFDRLFAIPILVVALTLAATIAVQVFVKPAPSSATSASVQLTVEEGVQIASILGMVFIQLFCFYWRARARYAIYGALLVGGVMLALTLINLFMDGPLKEQPLLPLMAAFGLGLATAFYAFIGVGFASLGGYVRIRREEQGLRQQSRQELLERLFEIESALREAEVPVARRRWPWVESIKQRIYLYSPTIGFLTGLVIATSTLLIPGPLYEVGKPTASYVIAQIVLQAAFIAIQVGFSYLGGNPLRGMLVSLLFGYASTAAMFLPIGTMGFASLSRTGAVNFIAGTAFAIVIGLFAGLGATVEERAHRQRRRRANDPVVLLSELVEIQRILNPSTKSKCVLVVDAAKSSVMKAHADPLVAEWSFRAYQEFIAEIVVACGGQIHSTAGDGAMAAFDDAKSAFRAARTIQTKVSDFNAYVNRLKDPFRLRIGIHCGVVSGELDEVEFTSVLDVAAHVEAASQIGGIALTAPVAEQLGGERLVELPETIDDFQVFLAMNPTLDPDA